MAERPLECGECRRPIACHYSEITAAGTNEFIACAQCPVVQRRLYGEIQPAEISSAAREAGLCCGTCGTTLEAVQVGHSLGCANCYEVFADLLIHELVTSHKVSKRVVAQGKKKPLPLHVGRTPGESATISPAARLTALTEALNETLAREDYEQAAYLRDQIRLITGKHEELGDSEQKT
jgi:protein arginine kinase activator